MLEWESQTRLAQAAQAHPSAAKLPGMPIPEYGPPSYGHYNMPMPMASTPSINTGIFRRVFL